MTIRTRSLICTVHSGDMIDRISMSFGSSRIARPAIAKEAFEHIFVELQWAGFLRFGEFAVEVIDQYFNLAMTLAQQRCDLSRSGAKEFMCCGQFATLLRCFCFDFLAQVFAGGPTPQSADGSGQP